jgi:hypothetical protein
MAAPLPTAAVVSAVARVTGDPGRDVKHGKRFRIEVTSSDGHKMGVSVQVDDHPAETRPYVLNQIADTWNVSRDEIRDVLDSWGSEELREHLQKFPKAELMPPHLRR